MTPERLTSRDTEEVMDVLCAAFADYPVMRYVLAGAEVGHAEGLRALLGFFCNKRLVRDWPVLGVRVEGRLAAVALISEPGNEPTPPAVRALRDSLAERIGEEAFTRLMRYERESSLDAPREPHYFLGVIGVCPEYQGQGLARVLLDELARMSERHPDSTGVCLNTESPENVPFYEHMGYGVVGQRAVGSLETWCMFRPNAR